MQETSPFQPVLRKPRFSIFQAAERNRELAEQGYVIFPFLDAEAVQELSTFYHQHHAATPDRFYASAHVADIAFQKKMDQEIKRVLQPSLKRELHAYQALGGSFISKPPGQTGLLPPHADWNIVDEREFRSFNLWIPLVDTTRENGAVQVLPQSHDWLDSLRGPDLPNPFQPVMQELWEYLQPLEMKAGEALLYDHRLVHASALNGSQAERLACVFGILPAEAEMRLYCGESDQIAVYRSQVAFHLEHTPAAAPEVLDRLETRPASTVQIESANLEAFVAARLPHLLPEKDLAREAEKRNFWQVYTLGNIFRELKSRIFRQGN